MIIEHQSEGTAIRSWADRLRAAGLSLFVVFGGMLLLIGGLDRPGGAKQALVPVVAAYLAATVLVVTWRISRMGVRFDARGITVSAFFRTSMLRWPEVHGFTDGSAWIGETRLWALKIVLRDERAVTAGGNDEAADEKGDGPSSCGVSDDPAGRRALPGAIGTNWTTPGLVNSTAAITAAP